MLQKNFLRLMQSRLSLAWISVGFILGLTSDSMGCFAQDVSADTLEQIREAGKLLGTASENLDRKKYEQASKEAWQSGESLLKLLDDPELKQTASLSRWLQVAGEVLYRSGDSKNSLKCFNKVVELRPDQAPFNWQRGIALCSCGQFEEGAKQFETHHKVNPDDVENSAWYFLCVAKTKGIEAARKTVIPSRGDGRQPMMSVLSLLKEEIEPNEVMEAAIENTSVGPIRKRAKFYADLYIGLYCDSLGKEAEAAKYLKQSLSHGSEGYMVDVARVYLADRFANPKVKKD